MGLVMFVICGLPPKLVPSIKPHLIGNILQQFLLSITQQTQSLGTYYNKCNVEEFDVFEVLESTVCPSPDEKMIINVMLKANYRHRPHAAEILTRLKVAEQIAYQDEIRMLANPQFKA